MYVIRNNFTRARVLIQITRVIIVLYNTQRVDSNNIVIGARTLLLNKNQRFRELRRSKQWFSTPIRNPFYPLYDLHHFYSNRLMYVYVYHVFIIFGNPFYIIIVFSCFPCINNYNTTVCITYGPAPLTCCCFQVNVVARPQQTTASWGKQAAVCSVLALF